MTIQFGAYLTDEQIDRFRRLLTEAHTDENQGTAIGVRLALETILPEFVNGADVAKRLGLDPNTEDLSLWAAQCCLNPQRMTSGPYIPPPPVPKGTPWVFLMTGDGNKMTPDGKWLPDSIFSDGVDYGD